MSKDFEDALAELFDRVLATGLTLPINCVILSGDGTVYLMSYRTQEEEPKFLLTYHSPGSDDLKAPFVFGFIDGENRTVTAVLTKSGEKAKIIPFPKKPD